MAVDLELADGLVAEEVLFALGLDVILAEVELVEFLPDISKLLKSRVDIAEGAADPESLFSQPRSVLRAGMGCRVLAPRPSPRASRPELTWEGAADSGIARAITANWIIEVFILSA